MISQFPFSQIHYPKQRILLVEDEPLAGMVFGVMVQQSGRDLIGLVASMSEALAFVEEQRPDIVIADVYLKVSGVVEAPFRELDEGGCSGLLRAWTHDDFRVYA